jgi:phosphopantothenoylcysteine decarboxylase
MNTLMYMHPLTASHLAFARDVLGYHIIGPIEKRLACGDLGQGAMQEWSDIVDLVVNRYSLLSTSYSSQKEAV